MDLLAKIVIAVITVAFMPFAIYFIDDVARDKDTPILERCVLIGFFSIAIATLILAFITVVIA